MEGKIKKLMRDRGFGFISGQNGQEVFFHRSNVFQINFDNLREGQQVEFELQSAEKGPRALNVTVTDDLPPQAVPIIGRVPVRLCPAAWASRVANWLGVR